MKSFIIKTLLGVVVSVFIAVIISLVGLVSDYFVLTPANVLKMITFLGVCYLIGSFIIWEHQSKK